MKAWKLSLAGLLSVCLISTFAKGEERFERLVLTDSQEINTINAVVDDVLANSKMWRELEEVSSHIDIRIRWNVPKRREIVREMRHLRYQKRGLKKILRRGKRYIPLIKRVFKKYRIPDELVFLPVIESSFDIKAVSPAGAAGLWQFMPATAREYGLRVDRWVDERYDVEKSTIAAARYLRDLYRYFRNWGVVLASYNVGKYAVLRKIRGRGTYNFWSVKSHLPKPARRYTIKFFATIQVLKTMLKREKFKETDMDFEIVKVRRGVSLRKIAKITGVSVRKLKKLNPHIKRGYIPRNKRGVFNIYVPRGYKHSVEVALNLKDLNMKLSQFDTLNKEFDMEIRNLNIDGKLKNIKLDEVNADINSPQMFDDFKTSTIF